MSRMVWVGIRRVPLLPEVIQQNVAAQNEAPDRQAANQGPHKHEHGS